MKRRLLQLLLLSSLSCAIVCDTTGCTSVPKTAINFNPKTGALTISSPKNVSIESASATLDTNGIYSLTVKGYSSTNDNSVVQAVATSNANMMKALSDTAVQALGTAIQASK